MMVKKEFKHLLKKGNLSLKEIEIKAKS